jgi:hypothetical protein
MLHHLGSLEPCIASTATFSLTPLRSSCAMQATLTTNKLASTAVAFAAAAIVVTYLQMRNDMTSDALWRIDQVAISV